MKIAFLEVGQWEREAFKDLIPEHEGKFSARPLRVGNAIRNHLDHDMVIVHDPQPLPIVNHYWRRRPWI